eukprot:TRINITY_DN2684_c0_g1_i1.p2 TRINITY_DN2684_c0_g1~~TRINITY_DN2684_c0_g1_i1.p2  ORF type:complete len:191 (+),score=-21.01 TRINITY_DN2684_c0_g1_i1:729-1301(+)
MRLINISSIIVLLKKFQSFSALKWETLPLAAKLQLQSILCYTSSVMQPTIISFHILAYIYKNLNQVTFIYNAKIDEDIVRFLKWLCFGYDSLHNIFICRNTVNTIFPCIICQSKGVLNFFNFGIHLQSCTFKQKQKNAIAKQLYQTNRQYPVQIQLLIKMATKIKQQKTRCQYYYCNYYFYTQQYKLHTN